MISATYSEVQCEDLVSLGFKRGWFNAESSRELYFDALDVGPSSENQPVPVELRIQQLQLKKRQMKSLNLNGLCCIWTTEAMMQLI